MFDYLNCYHSWITVKSIKNNRAVCQLYSKKKFFKEQRKDDYGEINSDKILILLPENMSI